jgi:hypothetical protein
MVLKDNSNWILPVAVRNLISLRIGFSLLNYADLCVLIGPCLHRLYLEVYDGAIQIDFAYLGSLLMSIPQKLEQFNSDYRKHAVDINVIRSAHRLFRNMQLVHSYSNDTIKLICKNMNEIQDEGFDLYL